MKLMLVMTFVFSVLPSAYAAKRTATIPCKNVTDVAAKLLQCQQIADPAAMQSCLDSVKAGSLGVKTVE